MAESLPSQDPHEKSYPFSDDELARMNAGGGGEDENEDFRARGDGENLARFHEAMKKISGAEIHGIAFDPALKDRLEEDERSVYGQLLIKTDKGDVSLTLFHDYSDIRHGYAVAVVAKYPVDNTEEKSEINFFAME